MAAFDSRQTVPVLAGQSPIRPGTDEEPPDLSTAD